MKRRLRICGAVTTLNQRTGHLKLFEPFTAEEARAPRYRCAELAFRENFPPEVLDENIRPSLRSALRLVQDL
jgi:hypothetical protein